ncbi:DnaJ-domain-containing protein [Clathrospora elynae]|uniref:DnaJ-domain-containing protein n=1 Tax=Clathrospora elynae TaxID=706981 RepID=A0A6A5T1J5_9PLEO|nr:DnaJ-domain-containing protein [Clathrospora elynae]
MASSEPFRDYYSDLGLKLGASAPAIKSAFHTLARQHHPDKSGSSDTTVFRRAREAFEKLSDIDYRACYDRSYWYSKLQTDPVPGEQGPAGDGGSHEGYGNSRTAQYEAQEKMRRRASPPPVKPYRKMGEPSWKYFMGRAYTDWQKRDAAHRMRHPERDQNPHNNQASSANSSGSTAHGLRVQMTSHPSTQQRCMYRAESWTVQRGGTDYCVFCMVGHAGGSRCPGCEALACPKCLEEIIALARNVLNGLGSRAQYRSSGG